jgi:hypothetical protein
MKKLEKDLETIVNMQLLNLAEDLLKRSESENKTIREFIEVIKRKIDRNL